MLRLATRRGAMAPAQSSTRSIAAGGQIAAVYSSNEGGAKGAGPGVRENLIARVTPR